MLERNLKTETARGLVDVRVLISPPSRKDDAWTCGWEIEWPDRVRANEAGGMDAIQALIHALQMVGIELYTSEEHLAGRLRWGAKGDGYGFPLTGGCRDLLEGADAQYL